MYAFSGASDTRKNAENGPARTKKCAYGAKNLWGGVKLREKPIPTTKKWIREEKNRK